MPNRLMLVSFLSLLLARLQGCGEETDPLTAENNERMADKPAQFDSVWRRAADQCTGAYAERGTTVPLLHVEVNVDNQTIPCVDAKKAHQKYCVDSTACYQKEGYCKSWRTYCGRYTGACVCASPDNAGKPHCVF